MKNLILIVSIFSVSLFANDPCEDLTVHASLIRVETDINHPCKPIFDGEKDRIVIRQPGYEGLNTLEEVAAHELNHRKWCGLGGHYYVDQDGRISQGRPDTMQGSNEINGADANKNKLGIQVLLPKGLTELPEPFVASFTKVLLCKMHQYNIAANRVKTHFHEKFHPGALVQNLLNKILSEKAEL